MAGIFGQMEMDSSDGFSHPHADPHTAGEAGMPSGEHPYGEFPSPTLFVRNINSNVEDDELRALFEPFGPIRSMCVPVCILFCVTDFIGTRNVSTAAL